MATGYSNGLIDVSGPQPSSWPEYSEREVGVHATLCDNEANRVESHVNSSRVIDIWLEIDIDKQCRLALLPSWKPKSHYIANSSLFQVDRLTAACRPSLDPQTFETILDWVRKKWVGTTLSIRVITVGLIF